MSQSTSKPLPNIPNAPVLPQLSVEGNALISLLTQQAINEEALDSFWLDGILLATAAFGDYLGSPEILSSLKAGRVIREAYQSEVMQEQRQGREQSRIAKGKASDTSKIELAMAEPILPPVTDAMKLKEIYAAADNTVASTTSQSSHLFLTVKGQAGASEQTSTDEDDNSPPQSCVFLSDTYSFPFFDDEEGQKGDGGTVLFGLENWSCELNP